MAKPWDFICHLHSEMSSLDVNCTTSLLVQVSLPYTEKLTLKEMGPRALENHHLSWKKAPSLRHQSEQQESSMDKTQGCWLTFFKQIL